MGISKEHFQGVPGCGPCRSIPTFAFGLFFGMREKDTIVVGLCSSATFFCYCVSREIGMNYRFRLSSVACSPLSGGKLKKAI